VGPRTGVGNVEKRIFDLTGTRTAARRLSLYRLPLLIGNVYILYYLSFPTSHLNTWYTAPLCPASITNHASYDLVPCFVDVTGPIITTKKHATPGTYMLLCKSVASLIYVCVKGKM
jgi:hypothetical protein